MKKILCVLSLFFTGILALAGCQSPAPTPVCPTCPTQLPVQATVAPTATLISTSTPAPTATSAPSATPAPTQTPWVVLVVPQASQPVTITGSFQYTNDFVVETYYVEHAVALVDMHGFVIRDKNWEIPAGGQTLGVVKIDTSKNTGAYQLRLPAQPAGVMNDVNPNGRRDAGVQIFAVSYWPNLSGGPFSEGDDRSFGWPGYLASVITDSNNKDEVTGGKLLIWAPDDRQSFPTNFGPDGLLFTGDDPVAPLPAGYSVVNLDSKPFGMERTPDIKITLYEPADVAVKDFSGLTYTQAFQKMFDVVRKEYAFNGIKGKQPDWDRLLARLEPMVRTAENNRDATAYYRALQEFIMAFQDGHVSLQGGKIGSEILQQRVGSGYGLAIRELDDGKTIVVFITKDGPAERAGIKVGAEVLEFNGRSIREVIGQVKIESPQSTDFGLRYQQARYLLRAPTGQEAELTLKNPGDAALKVKLTAVKENQSFSFTSVFRGYDYDALPVEFSTLPSKVGYIRINSNYDDLNLVIRLFERALKTFTANEAPGVIIDMRQNSGGAPLGLAGFLTDKEIPLGQLEYFSDKTGRFEAEGQRQRILPNETQYRFKKMAILVGQACYSACEIEAYAFSKVPGMLVVGQYPTGGVEAEVARGEFRLPAGFTINVPTGRFTLPDGSIFLEGKGVQPILRVPINAANLLSNEDAVLTAAVREVLK